MGWPIFVLKVSHWLDRFPSNRPNCPQSLFPIGWFSPGRPCPEQTLDSFARQYVFSTSFAQVLLVGLIFQQGCHWLNCGPCVLLAVMSSSSIGWIDIPSWLLLVEWRSLLPIGWLGLVWLHPEQTLDNSAQSWWQGVCVCGLPLHYN